MYTKNQLQVELKVPALPPVSKEKTHVHKTLISGLSRKMSRRRAGEECLSGRRMPPLCLLLLLLPLSGATAALSLEGGLTGHYSHGGHRQEVAEIKKNSLLTFLARWYEWTSQARAAPSVGGDAREVSKRQDGPPPKQSSRPDKVPCRNFFWKTFSSCK
ncbi:cortistatin [Desmodus rotundus]|uniref:cortistatin n=1 Tax=Desmodus rotundus TaxID=9430 RepID=UPI002380DF34|nr:cortistatin [Desmodus rotundus]